MKQTKIFNLLDKQNDLVGVRAETYKEEFVIPVVDVRKSDKHRERAARMQKAVNIKNGSKFFKPTYSGMGYSYNTSMK